MPRYVASYYYTDRNNNKHSGVREFTSPTMATTEREVFDLAANLLGVLFSADVHIVWAHFTGVTMYLEDV